jgi:hypothetical protein
MSTQHTNNNLKKTAKNNHTKIEYYRPVSDARPMPRKLAERFGLATDIAKTSPMKVTLGACLFAGKRLISKGSNNYRSKMGRYIAPSAHAEVACISRMVATSRYRQKGAPSRSQYVTTPVFESQYGFLLREHCLSSEPISPPEKRSLCPI